MIEPSADERALWAAIRADPLDDLPRLVYADWLEERGRGERAEFIRVQIALERLPEDRVLRGRLWGRERALLAAHKDGWLAPLRTVLAGPCADGTSDRWLKRLTFRRGFASRDHFELVPAARVAEAGDRLEPLDALVVMDGAYGYRHGAVAMIAAWHGAGCVVGLDAMGCDDGDVAAVVASPWLRNLRSLGLCGGPVTDAGAAALAGWPLTGSVRHLSLTGTLLTDAGAAALADSPFFAALDAFRLFRVPLTRTGFDRLRARYGDGVSWFPP